MFDWPGGSWQETLRLVLTVLAVYGAVIWVALVFWVYRDIRQRTRDPIMMAVAVLLALVFFLPGHWIYLILRPRQTLAELYERSLEEEAILQDIEDQKACPACRRRVRDDYLVCPSCRTSLKEACANCRRPLDYGWVMCPYCAWEKPPRPAPAPAAASAREASPSASTPARPDRRGGLVRRTTSIVRGGDRSGPPAERAGISD